MVRTWRCRSATVALVIGVVTACLTASPAGASSSASSRAQQLVREIDADVDAGSLAAGERGCLTRALTARPALTKAALAARSMSRLRLRDRAELYRVIAACAPAAVVRQVGDLGAAFDGLDVPREEARCLVQGMGALDNAVLIAAIEHRSIEQLSNDAKRQVLELDTRCIPTPLGEKLLEGMLKGTGIDDRKVDPAQARCVGQALAGSIVEAGVGALGGTTSPELRGAAVRAAAQCAPALMVDGFTATFLRSGMPPSVAACMARGLVADPSLAESVAVASARGETDPPLPMKELAASCR